MTISYLSDNSLCTCIAYGRDVGGFLGEYHGVHGAQRRDTSSLKEFKGREGGDIGNCVPMKGDR